MTGKEQVRKEIQEILDYVYLEEEEHKFFDDQISFLESWLYLLKKDEKNVRH